MLYLAEAVLLLHLSFIVFVLFGALLTVRWRWVAVAHLPAVLWGIFIEVSGGACPLTHAENYFRTQAGQAGYTESFIEHHLLAILYPVGLTREVQWVLAGVVVGLNIAIYSGVFYYRRKLGQKSA